MFIDYYGYKLRVSHNGVASYVTPEITIYKDLRRGETNIYTPYWSATIRGKPSLEKEIITGEFFDKIVEQNKIVKKHPVSIIFPKIQKYFTLFDYYKSPHHIIIDKGQKPIMFTTIAGKKMIAENIKTIVDEDYRLFIEPVKYKTAFVPCLNGYAKTKERIYLEDTIDKYHEEIPAKTTNPLVPTSYLQAINPDYVYKSFSVKDLIDVADNIVPPMEVLFIVKKPLTAAYCDTIKAVEIYYKNKPIKIIEGKKRKTLDELVLLLQMGDGILLL